MTALMIPSQCKHMINLAVYFTWIGEGGCLFSQRADRATFDTIRHIAGLIRMAGTEGASPLTSETAEWAAMHNVPFLLSVPGTEILYLLAPRRKGIQLSTHLGLSRRRALSYPALAGGGGRSEECNPTVLFCVTCLLHDFPEEFESSGGKLKFAGVYIHSSL